jgi:hypothetical protein
MPEVLFTLFGDLAAETWYKAAQRCRAMHPQGNPAPAADAPPGKNAAEGRDPNDPPPGTLISESVCS